MAFGGHSKSDNFNCELSEYLVEWYLSTDEGREWVERFLQEKGFQLNLKSVAPIEIGISFIRVDTNHPNNQHPWLYENSSLMKQATNLAGTQGGFGAHVLGDFKLMFTSHLSSFKMIGTAVLASSWWAQNGKDVKKSIKNNKIAKAVLET